MRSAFAVPPIADMPDPNADRIERGQHDVCNWDRPETLYAVSRGPQQNYRQLRRLPIDRRSCLPGRCGSALAGSHAHQNLYEPADGRRKVGLLAVGQPD